jgi:hypothetical protein
MTRYVLVIALIVWSWCIAFAGVYFDWPIWSTVLTAGAGGGVLGLLDWRFNG